MSSPYQCLIYKNRMNGELMWIVDYESYVEKRNAIMKEMSNLIQRLTFDYTYPENLNMVINKETKALLSDLSDKGRYLAMINSKLNCEPLAPNNPTICDANKLAIERDCLISKISQYDKMVKQYQLQKNDIDIYFKNQPMPKASSQEVQDLIFERDQRIIIVRSAMQAVNDIISKKVAYEMQPRGHDFKFVISNLNAELVHFKNILDLNNGIIVMLDNKIRQLDPSFYQTYTRFTDKDVYMLMKKEALALKIKESIEGQVRAKNRKYFIDNKLLEFDHQILQLATKMNNFNNPTLVNNGFICMNSSMNNGNFNTPQTNCKTDNKKKGSLGESNSSSSTNSIEPDESSSCRSYVTDSNCKTVAELLANEPNCGDQFASDDKMVDDIFNDLNKEINLHAIRQIFDSNQCVETKSA